MKAMRNLYLILALCMGSFCALSQEKAAAIAPEFASPEGLVEAMYKVISGPAGERNWEKVRNYCKPGVQFNVLSYRKDGSSIYRSLRLEDYIATAGKHFLTNDFYETPLGQSVQQFGPVAQVFSAYSSRNSPDGDPFDRGVNSFQLVKDEGRWWIVNVLWTSETPKNPIPATLIQN
jgi:hypothetical protein